jgi:hypothetical protein
VSVISRGTAGLVEGPAAVILAALALAGCDTRVAHVFGAFAYEADGGLDGGGCLSTTVAADLVDGPAPAAPCKQVRCWIAPGGAVYVTDMACDAPSDYQDHTQDTSGPCVAALAAYAADGGAARCPAPPADGGS